MSKWDIENVIEISNLFGECKSLKSLPDISKWNTGNIKSLNRLFYKCESLVSLPDISKWNTKNIKSMNGLFEESNLKIIPDISKWNTENLINISNMFFGCSLLVSLPDISKWNFENVLFINGIFEGCSSLISIPDISKYCSKRVHSFKLGKCRCSSDKKCLFCQFNEIFNNKNFKIIITSDKVLTHNNNNELFSNLDSFNDKKNSIDSILKESKPISVSNDNENQNDNSNMEDSSSNEIYNTIHENELIDDSDDNHLNDYYENFYS